MAVKTPAQRYATNFARKGGKARWKGVDDKARTKQTTAAINARWERVRRERAERGEDCPHPERGGRHEWYVSDGSTFCRACGADLTPGRDDA